MADSRNGVPVEQTNVNGDLDDSGDGTAGSGMGASDQTTVQKTQRPSRRKPDDRVQHRDLDRQEGPRSLVDQLTKTAKSKQVQAPYDPVTSEACPFFWELMTLSRYSGGEDRFLPEMKILRVDGGHECIIQDVETGYETRFLFTDYLDLARAAEKHLTSPGCVWKPFKCRKNSKGIGRHDAQKNLTSGTK